VLSHCASKMTQRFIYLAFVLTVFSLGFVGAQTFYDSHTPSAALPAIHQDAMNIERLDINPSGDGIDVVFYLVGLDSLPEAGQYYNYQISFGNPLRNYNARINSVGQVSMSANSGMTNLVKSGNTISYHINSVPQADELHYGNYNLYYASFYTSYAGENSWVLYSDGGQINPCGNGVIDSGEQCDGNNFNGQTCQGQGFDAGTLGCSSYCNLVTTGCSVNPVNNCGNGVINSGEQCDGSNLNGQTCVSRGFASGTLSCGNSCLFVTSGCNSNPQTPPPATCGNGAIDSGEQCDGNNFAGQTCASRGFDTGALGCSSCSLVTSGCYDSPVNTCGNGVIDSGEQCDGNNLNSLDCTDFGHDSGTLTCGGGCNYDFSACSGDESETNVGYRNEGQYFDGGWYPQKESGESCDNDFECVGNYCKEGECLDAGLWERFLSWLSIFFGGDENCGNGAIDSGEQCDGSNLNGQTCVGQGYDAGELSCADDCSLDVDMCENNVGPTICGDGLVSPSEDCDCGMSLTCGAENGNLNGATCQSEGYSGGDLACNACAFDYNGCEYDSSSRNCGDGVIQRTEDCEGSNLNGATCQSEGYSGGNLGCTVNCDYNTADCISRIVSVQDPNELEYIEPRFPSYDDSWAAMVDIEEWHADRIGDDVRVTFKLVGNGNGGLLEDISLRYVTTHYKVVFSEYYGAHEEVTLNESGVFDGNDVEVNGNEISFTYSGQNYLPESGSAVYMVTSTSSSVPRYDLDNLDTARGTINYAGEIDYVCGDGNKDYGEQCDLRDLGGSDCHAASWFSIGDLACSDMCTFDISDCVYFETYYAGENCGNGEVDSVSELCDESDLGGYTCEGLGYDGGELSCINEKCMYDDSGCFFTNDNCGNGAVDNGEECDGGNLDGATCYGQGYGHNGLLGCNADCTFNRGSCSVDDGGENSVDLQMVPVFKTHIVGRPYPVDMFVTSPDGNDTFVLGSLIMRWDPNKVYMHTLSTGHMGESSSLLPLGFLPARNNEWHINWNLSDGSAQFDFAAGNDIPVATPEGLFAGRLWLVPKEEGWNFEVANRYSDEYWDYESAIYDESVGGWNILRRITNINGTVYSVRYY
jgi:hypothetical protein